MINLYPTIIKLEELNRTLSDPFASFENQLQAVIDFKKFDLEAITGDLRDQQFAADNMKYDLDGYEQQELNLEHEGANNAA